MESIADKHLTESAATPERTPAPPGSHKRILIDMAAMLLDVCRRNNLRIWANSGTLLGAVRHGGFIPWDNDIDMVMPRDDYERLIELAPKEFTDPYFLQCADTEPGYGRGHAQLRNSMTAAVRPEDIWQPFNQGIFIDIFVLDVLPYGNSQRREVFAQLEHMRRTLVTRNYGTFLAKHFFAQLCAKLTIDRAGGYRRFFHRMERLLLDCPRKSETKVGIAMWSATNPVRRTELAQWYETTEYLPFEELEMPVPGGYDEYLRHFYGDYMTPVEQPDCHGNIIIDTTRPYGEVVAELRRKAPLIDKLRNFFSLNAATD